MKKLLTVTLVVLLLLCLTACGTDAVEKAVPPEEEVIAETLPEAEPTPAEELPAEDIFLEEVDSSCFSAVGYDEARQLLVVKFRDSGSAYTYSDFPPEAYAAFRAADSLGSYYNTYIKGQYPSERLY